MVTNRLQTFRKRIMSEIERGLGGTGGQGDREAWGPVTSQF